MPQLSQEVLERHLVAAREYLVHAAWYHQVVDYSDVYRAMGTGRAYIGQVLDELNRREHAVGRPLLSAIVVSKQGGAPSRGFYAVATELGLYAGGDKQEFWTEECKRVWNFDWRRR
jgi:hypothetical protein